MPPANSSSPPASEPAVIRLQSIVVTTDFSDAARQALPLAGELANQFGAALSLAYVIPTALPGEWGHIGITFEPKQIASEAWLRLERLRETELPANVAVEPVLLEGGPADRIVAFAKDSEVDLIVVATRGHTALKHFWLGSTTERIVRHAPCPVLVVRAQPVPVRFPSDVLCRFRHILVPTDFSDASQPALRYATAFARRCGGEVTLIHVIEPPPYPEFGYAHVPLKEAGLKRKAIGKLGECCRELELAGIKNGPVIRSGSAFSEITEHARQQGVDLIVIGTHGRSAIAHALLGSTTERVVRHAPCPVLVVRQQERDFISATTA